MRSLLEQLRIEVDSFVREHREAPVVRLTRTRDNQIMTAKLVDVGTDFVELEGFTSNPLHVKISRSQIAEITLLGKKSA